MSFSPDAPASPEGCCAVPPAARNGSDLCAEEALLVACNVEGLILVSENKALNYGGKHKILGSFPSLVQVEYHRTMDKLGFESSEKERDLKRSLLNRTSKDYKWKSSIFGNMEGSPYQQFAFSSSWRRFLEPIPGYLILGLLSVPKTGTQRCISPGFLRWRRSGEAYNGNSSAIPLGDLSGEQGSLASSVSVVYDEYQKVKARKRCLSYTPPPRLAWGALSAEGLSSISSTSTEIISSAPTSWMILLRGVFPSFGEAKLIEDFESFLRSDPFRVYTEDLSPEWSFTGKMRYLILLLGTPYLARVFGVPRYLTTCGNDTCGSSPSPSWGMMLLWAEFAGAYESSTLNSSLGLSLRGTGSPDMMLRIWALNRKDSGFVSPGFLCWRSSGDAYNGNSSAIRWVTFLVSREALRHSRVWGNVTRSPVSVVYDEYQKVKARKRCLSYTPPPRLARAALSAEGLSSISSTSTEIIRFVSRVVLYGDNEVSDPASWYSLSGRSFRGAELMSLARILDSELFLGVIVAGNRFSRYDASYLGLESKGLWVLTTSELA
ncbi:LOW QUALITY PROTEIN: hypothetical protein HID58_074160 [Brassica napus]|uniref:Uncharacterized protein n=1 Tax=Brassica napus TaxID=3708 RepID=A0ABQ7YFX9_BRANA|nr:LOW QUALITY PROTEIN: hypothetical protein HID58_074160 [Brassica napus]